MGKIICLKNRHFVQKFLAAILIFLFPWLPGTATAQTRDSILTGRVMDETGVGIIGASVSVKGTTVGTTTDMAGKFSLSVSSANVVLVISYVGYQTREIAVAGLEQKKLR